MTTPTVPAEAKILARFDTLGNWGRRGDDDELGARHLITDAKRRQEVGPPAASTPGIYVHCSPLRWHNATGSPVNPLATF